MEHRLLTGDSLHEPKGIEDATSGQVYVSNGAGSGVWTDRLSGFLYPNQFFVSGNVPDISTSNSSFFAIVPYKSTTVKVGVVLSAGITTADAELTMYKNGVAQNPTLLIPFTGSTAGSKTVFSISPAIAFNENDTVEVRSNGASDTNSVANVTIYLTAVA